MLQNYRAAFLTSESVLLKAFNSTDSRRKQDTGMERQVTHTCVSVPVFSFIICSAGEMLSERC